MLDNFLAELKSEVPSTRKCLARIPEKLYDWKPHEKSMTLGYLTLLVAEIPKWISVMREVREIDFQTFTHKQPKSTEEMLSYFDENVDDAIKSLSSASKEELEKPFVLRNGEQILINSPLGENIASTLNHWVHHRGQLTVYMRLNDIAVPSIYGPSADDRGF
jgi:uncharacterized damage-inducible protein DinB